MVAVLLKYERFTFVAHLLGQGYFVEKNADHGRGELVPFSIFRNYLESLEGRNKRLELRRLSLHSDLLKQRSNNPSLPFRYLIQADVVLFIRDCLDVLRQGRYRGWWPETLLYTNYSGATEIFARAESKRYFEKLRVMFDIESKDALADLFEKFKSGELKVPQWEFTRPSISILTNIEGIVTRP